MKGYSYPGKSPLKQSKFKVEGVDSNLDKLIKRIITPKKEAGIVVEEEVDNSFLTPHVPGKNDLVTDQIHMLPEMTVAEKYVHPKSTAKIDLSNKLINKSRVGNETNIKDRINKFHRMGKNKPPVEKEVKVKKEKNLGGGNEFLNTLAVEAAVAMLSREKTPFKPVNITGKQKKIM